jgi:hypothetical protein
VGVLDWAWQCPFCEQHVSDDNYVVVSILVSHHLELHEEQVIDDLEAMLRER